MRKHLLIYAPSVVLLIAAIIFPQMGRNVVGKMNGREFALVLAFWCTVLAVLCSVVRSIVYSAHRSEEPRGFEVVLKGGEESASK